MARKRPWFTYIVEKHLQLADFSRFSFKTKTAKSTTYSFLPFLQKENNQNHNMIFWLSLQEKKQKQHTDQNNQPKIHRWFFFAKTDTELPPLDTAGIEDLEVLPSQGDYLGGDDPGGAKRNKQLPGVLKNLQKASLGNPWYIISFSFFLLVLFFLLFLLFV